MKLWAAWRPARIRNEKRPAHVGLIGGDVILRRGLLALLLMLSILPLSAQKKKEADEKLRSVQGVVMSPDESPVQGAVVQLKDSKTLRIRSFISKEDGTFFFHGLSSATRTLSSFDSRKKPVINLKLEKQ
jgi:hypothetical protein